MAERLAAPLAGPNSNLRVWCGQAGVSVGIVAESGPAGIRLRVVRGVVWSCASLAGGRMLVLVSTSVLARLLSPRDFGLVALALIFTTAVDAVRDLGINQALIVTQDDDGAHADTAFSLTVVLGTALALLLAAVSPLVAAFLGQPGLVALLAVLAVNLPLRALGLTHYSLAQRGLDFRSRTIADFAEVVVRGTVSIAMAIAGLGPWSLVVGYLSGTLAWMLVLWTQVRWRPALRIRRADLSPLIRFGGGLTLIGVIGTAMGYVDNLFVGGVLGPAALGIYSLGYRLPETLIVDVVAAVGLVLFPALSMFQRSALRAAALAATRYVALLTLPVVVILLTLADPLVLALFGHRWHQAARVIQVLSIGFAGWPIGQVAGSAYMATKRVDVMAKLAVPQGVILVILIALFVRHGIVAVAACQAAVRVSFVAIGMWASTRVLGFRARELWSATWPPLVAAAGMTAVTLSVGQVTQSPWPHLISGCVLGAAAYLGLIWLLAHDLLSDISRLTRGVRTAPALATLTSVDNRDTSVGHEL
jgi:O-antigen/teichoic acid export membrane protein